MSLKEDLFKEINEEDYKGAILMLFSDDPKDTKVVASGTAPVGAVRSAAVFILSETFPDSRKIQGKLVRWTRRKSMPWWRRLWPW